MGGRGTIVYAAIGAVLSLGAPIGWLVIRFLTGGLAAGLPAELHAHGLLYGYLALATVVVFAAFGGWAGHLADRLLLSNARLETLATTDALTLLRNARHFHQQLRVECERADRERRPLALILIDLDHFKRVNDRWGHAVGDELLVHAATLMRQPLRATDLACRIGGEEFAILCPGAKLEEGRAIAERIREALASTPHARAEGPVPLTGSFGVAEYRLNGSSNDLFRDADAALYAAKGHGRNCVETAPALSVPAKASPTRTRNGGEARAALSLRRALPPSVTCLRRAGRTRCRTPRSR